MNEENLKMIIFLAFLILMIYLLTMIFVKLVKGSLNVDKYHENILLTVPKGTRDKPRAYALIKGYKNEQQLIAKLIADEIEKDKDKLQ